MKLYSNSAYCDETEEYQGQKDLKIIGEDQIIYKRKVIRWINTTTMEAPPHVLPWNHFNC